MSCYIEEFGELLDFRFERSGRRPECVDLCVESADLFLEVDRVHDGASASIGCLGVVSNEGSLQHGLVKGGKYITSAEVRSVPWPLEPGYISQGYQFPGPVSRAPALIQFQNPTSGAALAAPAAAGQGFGGAGLRPRAA